MFSSNFDMKDLRVADVILEIKVTRTPNGINLSQSHYMDKILERFKEHTIKENTNPFLPYIHLLKNTGTEKCQSEYSQIIESMMYLMNCTRLDIAYTVNKLSRYTSNPSDDHWTVLQRVVAYISNTKKYALSYEKYSSVLEGYNDENWIANFEESKSTSGYIFTLGGVAVS